MFINVFHICKNFSLCKCFCTRQISKQSKSFAVGAGLFSIENMLKIEFDSVKIVLT